MSIDIARKNSDVDMPESPSAALACPWRIRWYRREGFVVDENSHAISKELARKFRIRAFGSSGDSGLIIHR